MTIVTAPTATYRGRADGPALAFLGMPYARAPLGPLRFRPPEPPERGGQVDATVAGPAAIQVPPPASKWSVRRGPQALDEDCLNLNLWTPAADDARRPVIVHVFGGGFQYGSANVGHIDGPVFAARNDCVLVRPNLRTGALGFLHLARAFPDLDQTNRSMLDLIAALSWVRDNAAAFGGDPDNVTLVGLSSGAFTAAALFGTDAARGLFHRCWLMSGYASRILDPANAADIAADFLDRAGIAPGDTEALAALPPDRILALQTAVVATNLAERSAPGGRTLGLVLDGTSLPRHPRAGLEDGAGRDIPLVLGRTRHEARLWYARGVMGDVDADRLRATIARFEGPDGVEPVFEALAKAMPNADFRTREETFLTDRIYVREAQRTAEAQRAGGGRAWIYEFGWQPAPPFQALGAAHGFDEPFVYGLHRPDDVPVAAADDRAPALAARMEAALMALARSGDPGWSGEVTVFDA